MTALDTLSTATLTCVGCDDQALGVDHGAYIGAPVGWLRDYLVGTDETLAWCPRCSASTRRVLEQLADHQHQRTGRRRVAQPAEGWGEGSASTYSGPGRAAIQGVYGSGDLSEPALEGGES